MFLKQISSSSGGSVSPRRLILILFSLIGVTGFCIFWYWSDWQYTVTSVNLPSATTAPWRYTFEQAKNFAVKNLLKPFQGDIYNTQNLSFDRIRSNPNAAFDIEGSDVIVFLHIQKTAGTTFEKFLVRHLDIEQPCWCKKDKKRCKCYRPHSVDKNHWLFSRFSTGWSCGLHADWTELVTSNCVDNVLDKKEKTTRKRRYFYTVFLRDPMSRYISEYRHVQRGATWGQSRHVCNGRAATPEELPLCFDPDSGWEGVELDEFLSCPYNLANNRQTRMLSDLTLVGCYNNSVMKIEDRNRIMLESAKRNLKEMAFFGLKELMNESQYIFERTFGLRFTKSMAIWNKTKSKDTPVTDEQLENIKNNNQLDLKLYQFAKKLFDKRYEILRKEEKYLSEKSNDEYVPPKSNFDSNIFDFLDKEQ